MTPQETEAEKSPIGTFEKNFFHKLHGAYMDVLRAFSEIITHLLAAAIIITINLRENRGFIGFLSTNRCSSFLWKHIGVNHGESNQRTKKTGASSFLCKIR